MSAMTAMSAINQSSSNLCHPCESVVRFCLSDLDDSWLFNLGDFWQSWQFWQFRPPPPPLFQLFLQTKDFCQSTLGPPLRGPWATLGWPLGGPRATQSQSQTQPNSTERSTGRSKPFLCFSGVQPRSISA